MHRNLEDMKTRQIQRIKIWEVILKFINMFKPRWRISLEDIKGFRSIEDSVYSATRRFQYISIDYGIDNIESIGI